jgi:transcription elongation factor GreA
METTYISREGYEKLRDELDALRKQKTELSAEIGEAASQGDLSENAAYTYAKERQAQTLMRIGELEQRLRNAQLTDDLKVDKNEARIGATVTLRCKDGAESVYKLCGATESDPAQGKISVNSPMAVGILGKKAGETFKISLPKGEKEFTLSKIEYA